MLKKAHVTRIKRESIRNMAKNDFITNRNSLYSPKIVFLQVFGGHRLVGFWWAPAATIGNYLLMFYQHHNIQKICTYRRGVQPSALGTFLNEKTQNVETKLDFSHGKIQNIKI